MNTSIMDQNELDLLVEYLTNVKNLEGDVAELGVYKGGSAKVIAQTVPEKTVYLFDTFEGFQSDTPPPSMPGRGNIEPPVRFDSKEAGVDNLYEFVVNYLQDCPNAVIVKGSFPTTAADLVDKKFCFVHFDADLYQSAKDFMEFFYPRMTVGGVMIFHDWNQQLTGAKVQPAVEEFMQDKPEQLVPCLAKQCVIIKA